MVPKRRMPLNGSNSIKRRKTTLKPVEEVVFDTAAREDFLSGFHKRKLARARHAQEAAAKKERARRIEARRLVGETLARPCSTCAYSGSCSYVRGEKGMLKSIPKQ